KGRPPHPPRPARAVRHQPGDARTRKRHARRAFPHPVPGGARRLKRAAAHVLVVDDEPDIRELLELTLVRMGLDVASVGTIAEAKEKLRQDRYDLCLTDMRLSDGEGLDLVRHIAGQAAEVPVA